MKLGFFHTGVDTVNKEEASTLILALIHHMNLFSKLLVVFYPLSQSENIQMTLETFPPQLEQQLAHSAAARQSLDLGKQVGNGQNLLIFSGQINLNQFNALYTTST